MPPRIRAFGGKRFRATGVVVTGERKILRRLRKFAGADPRGAKTALRRASTKAVRKVLLPVYKHNVARVAMDTRALYDTVTKRASRARRGWYKGKIGSRLYISRVKLIGLRTSRQSGSYVPKDQSGREFFYPAVVEYGTHQVRPKRPMHHAMKQSEGATRSIYMRELRKQIQLIRSIK